MATNVSFGSKCMIKVIKGYQLFISPLLGPSCRFYPTCSQYAIEAFERFGLFKGLFLSVKRILKCQPLHPGGEDPVPDNPKRQFKGNRSCAHQVDIEQSKIHQSKSNK